MVNTGRTPRNLMAAVALLSLVITSPSDASAARFDKILTSLGAVDHTVLAVRVSDGKVLYQHEPDKALAPASVTKLIPVATSLVKWSADHTFKTGFWHTGRREGGKILGDLVIVGDGDPFVISEKLWQLAADMRHMGLTEFTGNLVIDNSLFGDEGRDESRQFGSKVSDNAYDAPVSAFGVNFNTFAIAFAPSVRLGMAASIGLDPYPLRDVAIDNRIRTIAAKKRTGVSIKRIASAKGIEKLIASGNIAQDVPIRKLYRSVVDHVKMSGEYVRSFLKAEGIQVRGKVVEGTKPANAVSLMDMESYEMRRIVRGLNVFSNNYIADVLVKRLGAAFGPQAGKPGSGTFASGIGVMQSFLENDAKIGSGFVLENGSGLDTDNRLSARHVVNLLTYMEKRFEVFPEFLASLPVSGMDGTMRKRFRNEETKALIGQVRAKTGTLSQPVSVAGLGGYVRHPQHGMLAFCIIQNGRKGAKQPGIADLRSSQDDLIAAWLKNL